VCAHVKASATRGKFYTRSPPGYANQLGFAPRRLACISLLVVLELRSQEDAMNRQTIGRALVVVLLAVTPLTAACSHRRHEGPAQAAGRKVDRGLDKAGDAVEDAGHKVNRALPGD
jgi:hypothetical protein